MGCLATKNGPKTDCSCKSGRQKPDGEFDPRYALMDAAKARAALATTAKKKAAAAAQGDVQSDRVKAKAEFKGDSLDDPDFVAQGDGNELQVEKEFEAGPPGFQLKGNAVSKVGAGKQAEANGVQVP